MRLRKSSAMKWLGKLLSVKQLEEWEVLKVYFMMLVCWILNRESLLGNIQFLIFKSTSIKLMVVMNHFLNLSIGCLWLGNFRLIRNSSIFKMNLENVHNLIQKQSSLFKGFQKRLTQWLCSLNVYSTSRRTQLSRNYILKEEFQNNPTGNIIMRIHSIFSLKFLHLLPLSIGTNIRTVKSFNRILLLIGRETTPICLVMTNLK